MHLAQAAGAAGLFVVAALLRLTRVTQGERFFTLWNAGPWRESACDTIAQKFRKSGKCSILWNILVYISFTHINFHMRLHESYRSISTQLLCVLIM